MGIYLGAAQHRSVSPARCEEMLSFCRCHAWHRAHEETRGISYQNRCRTDDSKMPFSHFPNTGKLQLPGMLSARQLPTTSAAPLRDTGLGKTLRTKSGPLLSVEKKKKDQHGDEPDCTVSFDRPLIKSRDLRIIWKLMKIDTF